MIDYLTDIKPLQDKGVSNTDIAAHLSNRTAQPMSATETVYTLQDSGAVINSPVLISQRSGTLIEYYSGLPNGQEKDLLAFFVSTVFSGSDVATNEYPRSTQFALSELNMPQDLQLVAETLVVQSGGRPDQGTSEADVVSIQQQWEQAEAARIAEEQRQQSILALQAEIENDYINPAVSDDASTADQVRAAIKAGL